MYPGFKPFVGQLFPQVPWNVIIMGHEIEGGSEPVFLIDLHQLQAFFYSIWSFYIMGQNKRKLFPIGPSRPVVGFLARTFIDRPKMPDRLCLPFCDKSP